jgi:hypothetical protein
VVSVTDPYGRIVGFLLNNELETLWEEVVVA